MMRDQIAYRIKCATTSELKQLKSEICGLSIPAILYLQEKHNFDPYQALLQIESRLGEWL